MGIFLWDTAPSKIFVGGSEVASVRAWDTKVRPMWPEECVIYKIKAVDGWRIYIGTHWTNYNGSINAPYSRYISIDGWPETLYTWTWWSLIALTWYTNYQIYTVKIRPSVVDYWWARACWWRNSWVQDTVLMEIVYDGSYIWYAASATDTWNRFRAYQYIKCTYITTAPEEYLPDTVTRIWTYFRCKQYEQCSKLTASPVESLPNGVTSIWENFRESQYWYCSVLADINWWKDLSIGGSWYRTNQYSGDPIKTVKVIWDVWYAAYNYYALYSNLVTSIMVQSAYLNNFRNTPNLPRQSFNDSLFVWY